LPLHGIEFPKEAKVRLDTEPALAESDKTSDMNKRVGRKMMQLDTIKEKQSTKEIVDWEGKSPKDKGDEHNPKPRGRMGNYLVAGKFDGLPILRDQAPLMELVEITLTRLRSPPATIGDTGGGETFFPLANALVPTAEEDFLGFPIAVRR
jgi:hypothetical protein